MGLTVEAVAHGSELHEESGQLVHDKFTPAARRSSIIVGRVPRRVEDAVRAAYDPWNRRDAEALVALADRDIEIVPLVSGVTSAGPWSGHDGVRALVADADARWARFEMRCDRVLARGDRLVAFPGAVLDVESPTRGIDFGALQFATKNSRGRPQTGFAGASGRYGFGDDRPLDRDDLFLTSSVTKTFTAAAVLRLVEKRKVRLDAGY